MMPEPRVPGQIGWDYHEDRVTPFSRINLDRSYHTLDDMLDTMNVELDEAVLVIRGKSQGRDVEFMVGDLNTQGPRNGMVLIRTEALDRELLSSNGTRFQMFSDEKYRILLDAELRPKNGVAYTVRVTEEQGF